MSDRERTDVVIYTQGWNQDTAAVVEEGPPTDQLKGRMFVNGVEIPHYLSARILTRHDDFLHLSVRLYASTLRIVPLANLNDLSTVLPDAPLPDGAARVVDRRDRVRAALAGGIDPDRLPGLDQTVERVLEALDAP